MMKNEDSSKPAKSRFRQIISKVVNYPMLIATVLTALCMLLAATTRFVPPSTSMLITFMGMGFPLLLLMSVIFAAYWIIKLRWYALIPIITMILCNDEVCDTVAPHFLYNGEKAAATLDKSKSLKVLSYNVRLFNFYDKNTPVLDYINHSGADVVCLQEFGYYDGSKSKFLRRQKIIDALQDNYPYFHISQSQLQMHGTYGIATFSKYPISERKELEIKSRYKSAMYTDIKVKNKTIRVYNVHLESNKLSTHDKQMVNNFASSSGSMNQKVGLISDKLSEAYKMREQQADAIGANIEQCKKAIILCGDLNDVPVSYVYNTLKGSKLSDSFSEVSSGYGYTYNENFFYFRIDHIMHNEQLDAVDFRIRKKVKYSDHYPIVVRLKWTDTMTDESQD